MRINREVYFDVIKLIFENAADCICIINQYGEVQWCNQSFRNIFGFEKEEMIGNNIGSIMPEVYAEKHNEYIQEYLSTGKSKIIGTGREVIARHKTGKLFSIYLSVSESFVDGNVYFIGIMHKVTANYEIVNDKLNKLEQLIYEWQSR